MALPRLHPKAGAICGPCTRPVRVSEALIAPPQRGLGKDADDRASGRKPAPRGCAAPTPSASVLWAVKATPGARGQAPGPG